VTRHVHVWRYSLDQASARSILARYLDRDPRSLEFVCGPYGKPRLVDGDGLEFSSARSGGVGVLAVACGRTVGVDVEGLDRHRALGPIADQLFAADEAAELRSLPEERRVRRFFELWTQKEAYAKALGTGMAVPLRRLRVPAGWSLHDLQLGPGFAGALCVRGHRVRIHMNQ
jgi:4'-phosphopantetheinyl transferase